MIFGGDFTGAVHQVGDADALYGEGDDVLAFGDATLAHLNGGTGEDTLRLDGPGFALDLTAISDLKVEGIESIDLQAGSGSHSLTLDLLEVLDISDTSNSLTILGDALTTAPECGGGRLSSAGPPA